MKNTKPCLKCHIEKSLLDFHLSRKGKFGRASVCKICRAAYSKENISKRRIYLKKYKKQNIEKIKLASHMTYLKYKNKRREKAKEYYLKNKRNILNKVYTYKRKRLKTDIGFRIKEAISCRIRTALKNLKKSTSTSKYLGCSLKEFKEHIESKFRTGMTWENYGYKGWHIDHIRPCASFDLSSFEQQKECFHYTNLQPLWAEENFKKHSSY